MIGIQKDRKDIKGQFPTHDEIQKRAYELYLRRGGEHGQDFEDWLNATGELRKERGNEFAPIKANRSATGQSELSSVSDRDFLIAEEELSQVGATGELKEEREGSTLLRTKTVSVGQKGRK
jgi:Protein of unknown function (DUF2934)